MGARRFCGRAAIADRANAISFEDAWAAYREFSVPQGKSGPYSLETGKFYDGGILKDRKDLVELHGDGRTLYIIAPWSNPKKELERDDAEEMCERIASMGHAPFIGIWHYVGRRHEEPSFAIDHGITRPEVWSLLEKFGQTAAYCVRYEGAKYTKRSQLR